MLYRRFGRTNLQMPVFSCGGMRYQHKWEDVPLAQVPADSQQNLEACINRSVSLGINHIETARGYGSSERQLGLILPKFKRDQLIVQTKVGPSENPADFVRGFEESLQRLQLQYVDLLAIHGINAEQPLDWSVRKGGCLEAARRLQSQGLARHIGFSTHAPANLICKALEYDFDYVNLHWFFIMQANWCAIEAATRRDMGVFIISPSDKGGKLYEPSGRLVELCSPLHPIVFNDLFCLSHPQVHTLSIGAARPSDFDRHVETLPHMADADNVLKPILDRLRQAYEAAVEVDLREPFGMGLPWWEQAPGQVHVQVILWLRNLVKAYDMREYAKMRYNLLGNGGHWFPGKRATAIEGLDFSMGRGAEFGQRMKAILHEAEATMGAAAVKRLSESK